MGLQKAFLRFKIAAVKGIDVPRYKLGRDWVLQVLGVKTVGDSEPAKEKKTPDGPTENHPETARLSGFAKILDVGERNEQRNRPEDKAEAKKTNLKVAKELQDSLEITQDSANKMVNDTRDPTKTRDMISNNTSQSHYVFGIVIFCAAIYLISYT